MKIGVFDSGIGGKTIADRLQQDYPASAVLYVDDYEHMPYGSRTETEIIGLTDRAIQPLVEAECDVIVIACNTATAAAIEFLRGKYEIPFVGLEPMVKPAAEMTKTGTVAICATPYTLKSQRYIGLKERYAADIEVIEPDCSEWAYMIEHNQPQEQKIISVVEEVCKAGADVIVLACTHYHWIKQEIVKLVDGKATVIDPSDAISRRVGAVLGI